MCFLFLLPLQLNAAILDEPTLTAPMAAYYKLDEVSGVRYATYSSNDLTDVNTVGSGVGALELAADFETSNSEYLSIADGSQSGLDLTSMTLSAWVKFETAPGSNRFDVITKYNGTTNRSYRLQVGDGNQLLLIQLGTAGTNYCAKSWTPSTGVWYHIAGTFSDSANESKLYVDGSQLGTTCSSMNATPYNGTAEFRIGSGQDAGNYFDGLIDEVYIASDALNSTAIGLLYNSGSPLPYEYIEPTLNFCYYHDTLNMNATTTCVTDGATTTCLVDAPNAINYLDWLQVNLWIIFFLSLIVVGFFFTRTLSKKNVK